MTSRLSVAVSIVAIALVSSSWQLSKMESVLAFLGMEPAFWLSTAVWTRAVAGMLDDCGFGRRPVGNENFLAAW